MGQKVLECSHTFDLQSLGQSPQTVKSKYLLYYHRDKAPKL